MSSLTIQPPTPFPTNRIGELDYYLFRNNDFIERCSQSSAPEYYLQYGNRYIINFSKHTYCKLTSTGQQWLEQTRINLQIALENRLKAPDAVWLETHDKALTMFAFGTHVEAYWSAGLWKLNSLDLIQILESFHPDELKQPETQHQIKEIISKLQAYWKEYPKIFLTRLEELVGHEEAIAPIIHRLPPNLFSNLRFTDHTHDY